MLSNLLSTKKSGSERREKRLTEKQLSSAGFAFHHPCSKRVVRTLQEGRAWADCTVRAVHEALNETNPLAENSSRIGNFPGSDFKLQREFSVLLVPVFFYFILFIFFASIEKRGAVGSGVARSTQHQPAYKGRKMMWQNIVGERSCLYREPENSKPEQSGDAELKGNKPRTTCECCLCARARERR